MINGKITISYCIKCCLLYKYFIETSIKIIDLIGIWVFNATYNNTSVKQVEDIKGLIRWVDNAIDRMLLHMQSMPITTDVVSSNLDQGEVYNIM